jgi:peroxiredoxin
VGISYDSPAILKAFSAQRGITFPLLSDAGSATIRAYGILNPAVEWGLGPDKDDPAIVAQIEKFVSSAGQANEGQRGMALPGTFVLDRQGRVTSRFFEDFYVERNTTESLLLSLGTGDEPIAATKIATGQVDFTTYASDASVAPGNRFSLVVEVTPHPGMHVYAPGAEGYRTISVRVDPQPWVQFQPVEYPEPEIYFFEPLNERVPVFQQPFTLIEQVLLEGSREAQQALQGRDAITITGTIDYQACDDAVCYNPASVQATWTLSLKALIRERPTVTP